MELEDIRAHLARLNQERQEESRIVKRQITPTLDELDNIIHLEEVIVDTIAKFSLRGKTFSGKHQSPQARAKSMKEERARAPLQAAQIINAPLTPKNQQDQWQTAGAENGMKKASKKAKQEEAEKQAVRLRAPRYTAVVSTLKP